VLWICRNLPEAPLIVLDESKDVPEIIRRHELPRIMRRPNPYYSGVLLMYGLITSWIVDGNGYVIKGRDRLDRVRELWYAPHWMLEAKTLHVAHALQRVPGKGLQLLELKTASSRRALQIPDVVVRALRAHRTRQLEERLAAGADWQDLGYVFTTYRGTPLSATNVIRRSYRPICRAAGVQRMRFHDLRVSAATLLLAQGVSQRVVMEILGHTSTRMTEHYTKVVPQLMKDAAAAMDRALGS
jgi:integrase